MSGTPPAIRPANTDGSLAFAPAGEPYTGNGWCLDVVGSVRHPRGDWQFRGDLCRIDDLLALADWLDAVAAGGTPEMVMVGGFMYPVLVFHVHGGSFNPNCYAEEFAPPAADTFRVTFGGDARLPWSAGEYEWAGMDFSVREPNLRATATDLRARVRALAAMSKDAEPGTATDGSGR